MKPLPFHILRIGMAVTFIWIGVLILKNPEAWGTGFIRPWAEGLLPVSVAKAMIAAGILDVAVGVWLMAGALAWIPALLGSMHLIVVLAVSGINAITVRDVGLLAGTLALFIHSLPPEFIARLLRRR